MACLMVARDRDRGGAAIPDTISHHRALATGPWISAPSLILSGVKRARPSLHQHVRKVIDEHQSDGDALRFCDGVAVVLPLPARLFDAHISMAAAGSQEPPPQPSPASFHGIDGLAYILDAS
jgi:hypothetical protein